MLDEPALLDRVGQRADELLLLAADQRLRALSQLELAERLLELRRAPARAGVCAPGGDHRPDELEREPDRARLERREPRRPPERVAEQLLLDPDLVAVERRVDRVAPAAEVDEVE